jgi:hypothetical protein
MLSLASRRFTSAALLGAALAAATCAPQASKTENPAPARPGGSGGDSAGNPTGQSQGGSTGSATGGDSTAGTATAIRPGDVPDVAAAAPEAGSADSDAPPVPGGGFASTAVSDYQLMVRPRAADGSAGAPVPFDIRGISWSPAARGAGKPDGTAYLAAADRDLPLMHAAGINVVKSYGPLPRAVLDKLLANDIAAIVTVLGTADEDIEAPTKALRDHPALLMWIIGNEWNLNRLFDTCAIDACYAKVTDAARRIKELDPNHAVATSFAPLDEIPTDADLRRLSGIDVWGLNVYSQPGFFNRFASWRLAGPRTGIKKPIFLSEYGADAYDNRGGHPDEAAQAAALRRQTQEIRAQLSARNPAFPLLGGTPFEWNDEWWKRGNPGVHDLGGFVHDGVAPDGFANEEWWGVVNVDRQPRAAYQVLKELYAR